MPQLSRGLAGVAGALLFLVNAAVVQAQRMVVGDGKQSPVMVESADVRTEVTGRIAVTTFDLVFRNTENRVLEGSFEFPLLAGQTVLRFALDIQGRMREAVPVEKERGRVVFEEIVRRGVDPGLLEQTAGNNYRARVYPIPARGTRRVIIAYQEDVARAGAARHRVALDFPDRLKSFRLAVAARTGTAEPPKASTTLGLELPPWQGAQLLEVTKTDFVARGVLELELPPPVQAQVLTEKRGEAEYFYAEVPFEAAAAARRAVPRVVGLLWDASGSGRERDHGREFALLDAWFAAVSDVEVRLVLLRDQAAETATFKVSKGTWSKLRRALEAVTYDGATSFDGLKDDRAVEEWLLFSDGLVNYGTTAALPKLPLKAPVHGILASARADGARLQSWCERQRGEFVNLLELTAADATARLRSTSVRVLAVERNPEQLAQIFPESGAAVPAGALRVTGILKSSAATLRLRIGHDEADARTVELKVQSRENPSELAARAWAATKIAALALQGVAAKEDRRRTSQQFGIVTADTSLIVLETLQDYLRYDIRPPEDLQSEWEDHRRVEAATRKNDRASQLNDLLRRFRERVEWWKTDFPKDKPDLEKRKKDQEDVVTLSPFNVADSGQRRRERAPRAATYGGSLSAAAAPRRPDPSPTMLGPALAMPEPRALELVGGAADSGGAEASTPGAIKLQRWDAKGAYVERLRRASEDDRYAVYLEERSDHLRQPGFFLDVAEFFFEAEEPVLALRILSNLAELQLEDAALLRVLAYRLMQAGKPELAKPLLERVLVMRGEEPQSRRDLALACAALKEYQRAVDLLWEVASRSWDGRFRGVDLIAIEELNAIVATCGQKLDLTEVDPRLNQNLPVGLRAVLTWDSDACDIDLWVDDPNGERALYSNPKTYQGGQMSNDFTGGYGPEEFILREPKPGKYVVRINYFGDGRQTALGPVTAQVRLITGFGTPRQTEELLTVRLTERKQELVIGTVRIDKQ